MKDLAPLDVCMYTVDSFDMDLSIPIISMCSKETKRAIQNKHLQSRSRSLEQMAQCN